MVIDYVAVESLAARVGLNVGDRVLTYGDRRLSSPAALQAAVENTVGKTAIALRVQRGDEDAERLSIPPGHWGVETYVSDLCCRRSGKCTTRAGPRCERSQIEAGSMDGGERAAQRSGEPEPRAAWLHWNVGSALENRQQWDQARAAHMAAWALLAASGDAATRATVLSALGQCSNRVNDLQGAEAWFAQAREVNVGAGNEMWAAANLNDLGVLARARGNLVVAQDYHTRARTTRERLAPDSLAVAGSLDNLGLVAFDRGDLTAAEDLQTRALAIRDRLAPDSLDVATSHNNLGNVAWTRGDLAAAKDHHNQALAIRRLRAPDSLDVAASLNNLGLVAWSGGDLMAAQADHSRALEIRERLSPGSLLVATSLNNLGEVARDRGDLARAQDFHSRSLAIKQQLAPDSLAVAKSLGNLGELARERGDFQAAQEYLGSALAIRERKAPKSLELAISLNSLGETARSRSDLPAAQGYHKRALELREQLAPGSLEFAESLNHLGDVALAGNDVARARDYYTRALEIRERMAPGSLEVASSFGNLGDVAKAGGGLAEAKGYYSRALTIQERLAPDSLEVAMSLVAMGDVAFRERRFGDALSLLGRSVRIVEAQRRQITSTDGRALLLALHSAPHAGLLRTYVALNNLPAAFATLERARARSLVDLLAERRLDFRADAPVELLTRQEELDQKRSAAYKSLTHTFLQLTEARAAISKLDPTTERNRITILEASAGTQEKRLQGLREELELLVVQQRELDTRIRRASPRLAALQYPEPLDLHSAQAALDSGTLLLTYVVDEETTFLFAVTKTEFQLFPLPVGRARLTDDVRWFRAMVAKEKLGDPAEPGRKLYDTLVRPAQALVNRAQRVLICPDGPLQALPFAALVSRPDPQLRYFIDDKPLHTISSVTVYAETRRGAADAARAAGNSIRHVTILAFGDPVYTKAQAAATAGKSDVESKSAAPGETDVAFLVRRGINLTPLPRTRDEVQAIVGLFGKSVRPRLGAEATETAAKKEAKDAGILHFASHGWTDEEMGLSSGLALTQPEALGRAPTPEDDGFLQAWEIFEHVRLHAVLVVLSACQTALGENVRGEGLVGLTRAFLYAGARSVAVTLWDVGDAGTVELMKTFYEELRKGTSKDVALQRAMIAVHTDPSHRHPFDWAPFVLVGDWK